MIRKIVSLFAIAAVFTLVSCGSKNTGTLDPKELTAPEITEETDVLEDAVNELEYGDTAASTEETDSTTPSVSEATTDSTETAVFINNEYPPLEEIEEPEIIDLPYVEPEEIKKALEEQEQAQKIEEPVAEEEELPPLPETAVDETEAAVTAEASGDAEALAAAETSDTAAVIEPEIEIQEEPEPIVIVPSRSVSLKKGESLVITYPGNGWIYMGSDGEYNNLASRGRKLGTADTKYTLLAKEAGTQIHHFYKVDNLTGEYIDDYIEVTVLEKKGSSNTVVNAPEYKEVVPAKPETPAKSSSTKNKEAQKKQEEEAKAVEAPAPVVTEKTTQSKTATSTKAATTTKAAAKSVQEDVIIIEDDEPEVLEVEEVPDYSSYVKQSKSLIDNKNYSEAYKLLNSYMEYANDNRDEALYLLGQILESDSPLKNIKEAINTYQTLCDNYPASPYWDNANKRIIYLKRFYIDIH